MRTHLTLFGKRFSMIERKNRRWLVSIFYGSFALLLLASRCFHGQQGFWLTVEFGILIGPILGGSFSQSATLFGSAGLVQPFDERRVLHYPRNSGKSYWASLFQPEVDPDPGILADERSAHRRNQVHYLAFKILGALIGMAFLIELSTSDQETRGVFGSRLSSITMPHTLQLLIQIAWLFVWTLPQAILLWTEPDLEPAA